MIAEAVNMTSASTQASQRDPQPFISVKGLTKVFHKPQTRNLFKSEAGAEGFTAVNNVDFEVQRGQIFVIMGLSGSGKSTIIRMINRLIDATVGEIRVDGQDVVALNKSDLRDYRNKTVNMVFQHFGLFPHISLLDNVAFGLKVRGIDRKTREEKAAEALEIVGLGDRLHNLPEELSGGMRQRVGLARALATDAEILLMDEPFSALDPLIRKDMQALLVKLQNTLKKTIIFVTHDLNEAMYLGDRIMVMKQGQMVQCGTAVDLIDSPADAYIEEFVADVDRSKVLTLEMLAGSGKLRGPEDAVPGSGTINQSATLNDLLAYFAGNAEPLRVVNDQGEEIGVVSAQEIFSALAIKEYGHGN